MKLLIQLAMVLIAIAAVVGLVNCERRMTELLESRCREKVAIQRENEKELSNYPEGSVTRIQVEEQGKRIQLICGK